MKWQPYKFTCPHCSSGFNSHRKDAKFCSRVCASESLKKLPIIKNCEWCKEDFDARAKNHNRELSRMLNQRFCSRKCMSTERATYHNQEAHHNWKGGEFMDKGYKRKHLYLGNGKRADPMQHDLIMEKHIGRKLNIDEVVHHKDRNRSNNEIGNLQLLTRSEHSKLHYELGHYPIASYKHAT